MSDNEAFDPKEGYRLAPSGSRIEKSGCIADNFERTINIMIGREDYDRNEAVLKALRTVSVSSYQTEFGIPHFAGRHALIETYVFEDGSSLIVAHQKKPYLPQYPNMFVFVSRHTDNDGDDPVIKCAGF